MPKPIERFCDKCKTKYDFDKDSILCPHKGFPKIRMCNNHNMTNCGNLECQTNLTEIKFPQEKRA